MPLLDWVNRNQAEETAPQVPYHLLKFEKSYGDVEQANENLIIQGDNLQALKALLPLYGGQVKCIFIDPPYNTQSAFEHYDDKLEHAQWLSMMYPRLQLLKELLAEDGSIWITLDDNESHYLKVLCDEVFGRKNFVSNVVWQKKSSPSNDANWISDNHDHILVYAKNKQIWRPNKLERTDAQNAIYKNSDEFDGVDESGVFYGRGTWFAGDMTVKTISENALYEITTPTGRVVKPAEGRAWVYSKEKFEELLADNRITFGKTGNNKPCIKRFLIEVESSKIVPKSVWLYEEVGENRNARQEVKKFNVNEPFSTPKPESLVQRVLYIASSKNDLVLDSFLGSGTTSAVAHKMGRRYIGIEMGEHAKTHVIPRLEKVIDGEQGGISSAVSWQGGGGFSFYTLGNPVFDDQGFLNAEVKFKDLAGYVWWLETKTALHQTESFNNPYLGTHDGVAYYLLYNGILGDRRPNGGNVLTSSILNYLNECHAHEGKRVVIGEASRLGDARLEALDIEFKQIPYSLYGNQTQ
ncbi:site-specific DNA-methyltransferase [Acinetobacter towneri]|uniref:site-specific DNA-methyltransferase n=1 Tax=Acinetobacter towneri TaxID=202956 RepID=UPI003A8A9E00